MQTVKHAYIETFGCQMNERDSEIMAQLLARADYQPTSDISRADLILVNTCSIRAKAEQKVYSLLGRLRRYKKKKPELIITVAGCVAQQEGKRIQSRMPHVDIVLGTQNIFRLPELVARAAEGGRQLAITLAKDFVIPSFNGVTVPVLNEKDAAGRSCRQFVTIMQGCNNFCTYCVVPYTRGRETSRRPADIIAEIEKHAAAGIREVTLLGQNVNSYRGIDSGPADFPALLQAIAAIDGIERIRFTTSHPKDLSDELIHCFARIKKLCPHFHLPVQSGSNRILKSMNRKYTRESYLERVEKLRATRPDIALTTDIIVGFPGESEEDFAATVDLLETVRFHSAFSFKYSDRPNAKAVSFPDKVAEDVKAARLSLLQARQEEITLRRNREFVGRTLPVMVEGRSKTDGQCSGRSTTNHIVNFPAVDLAPGRIVEIRVEEACLHSLRGRIIT